MLGFKNLSECTAPDTQKLARDMLETATSRCRSLIFDIAGLAETLVAPPPMPHFPPRSPIGEPGEHHEDGWEAFDDQYLDITEIPGNSFTLQFDDPSIEHAFAASYNAHLIKLDACTLLLFGSALASQACTTFTKFTLSEEVQLWRGFMLFLPLILLFLNAHTRTLYKHHRESLIIYYYAVLGLWARHVELYMYQMEAIDFTSPLYASGFAFLGVVVLGLHARFKLLLPLVVASVALNCDYMPTICSRFYSSMPYLACISYQVFWVMLMVCPPLFIVRWLEKRFRADFIRKMYEP